MDPEPKCFPVFVFMNAIKMKDFKDCAVGDHWLYCNPLPFWR